MISNYISYTGIGSLFHSYCPAGIRFLEDLLISLDLGLLDLYGLYLGFPERFPDSGFCQLCGVLDLYGFQFLVIDERIRADLFQIGRCNGKGIELRAVRKCVCADYLNPAAAIDFRKILASAESVVVYYLNVCYSTYMTVSRSSNP